MDPVAFIHITVLAHNIANHPKADDYKDAIVEYYMNDRHLTDGEIDALYEELLTFASEFPGR